MRVQLYYGFGGGPGQAAQLLPYPLMLRFVLLLSLVVLDQTRYGCFSERRLLIITGRKKMYKFFMSLKQKDGSFMVALMFVMLSKLSFLQVEFIIFYSGIYCLLVVSSMLDIFTPELVEDR
jgi:protein farnesyltransferase subunit beta